MRYFSVCSGIEAASVAWEPFGWQCAGVAEISPFPSAVLAHRFPEVPNYGDFTKIEADAIGPIDLLVGGTPCQAFSIAGLRGGLGDDRGNLALEFLSLADRLRPRWICWENVPGVLSSLSHAAPDPCPPPAPMDMGCDGQEVDTEDEYDSEELHAFNCFLAGLSEIGYGFAYRVLDAQYDGLAQRRERVFVIGYLGDWRPAAAVLADRESLSWHSAPCREPGQRAAPTISARPTAGGGLGTDFDLDGGLIAHALRREGHDASEDGTGRGTPIIPVAFALRGREGGAMPEFEGECTGALRAAAGGSSRSYVAFGGNNTSGSIEVATAINAKGGTGRCGFESETFIAFDSNENLETRLRNGITELTEEGMLSNANAIEAHAGKILRSMRDEIGEEAFSEWGFGIIAAFQSAQILQPNVHGERVREGEIGRKLEFGAYDVAQSHSEGAVRKMREAECSRRSPPQWRPPGQQAQQLDAYLSQLPQQGTQAEGFLCDLRGASEGLGLLQQALSALQEAWRSNSIQGASEEDVFGVRGTSAQQGTVRETLHAGEEGAPVPLDWRCGVRRLTPRRECERLQGFPDDFTRIPWRGRCAEDCPDGPRYKAIGNSMAVPCMRWIGERINIVRKALAAEVLA